NAGQRHRATASVAPDTPAAPGALAGGDRAVAGAGLGGAGDRHGAAALAARARSAGGGVRGILGLGAVALAPRRPDAGGGGAAGRVVRGLGDDPPLPRARVAARGRGDAA